MSEKLSKYAPGFYKTNLRAISLRELVRWRGWRGMWRLPFILLVWRTSQPRGGNWMPGLWTDYECTERELSDRFWEMTKSNREAFLQSGFTPCRLFRSKPHLNLDPLIRDNGGITYIHKNRCHIGMMIYTRSHTPAPLSKDQERVILAFTAAHAKGSLSCTNNRISFAPLSHQKVIRIKSDSPEFLYGQLLKLLERHRISPLVFPDTAALRDWFDSNQIMRFESHVQRGLYVPMSEQEVEAVRRKLPPPLPVQNLNS